MDEIVAAVADIIATGGVVYSWVRPAAVGFWWFYTRSFPVALVVGAIIGLENTGRGRPWLWNMLKYAPWFALTWPWLTVYTLLIAVNAIERSPADKI